MSTYPFILKDQQFWLHPEKALYWENTQTLLVADLHLGKEGHFQKAGIAVPGEISANTINRLETCLQAFKVERLFILGDLFHSSQNKAWDDFADWLKGKEALEGILVMGNHDFHQISDYEQLGLTVIPQVLEESVFIFSHEPPNKPIGGQYHFSGHIHPAVMLSGGGKQRLKLPCFYFGRHQAILPAFGDFTGTAIIQPLKGDQVFVIGDQQIFAV